MDVGDPAAAGHFTTMQVRHGAVQGLALHLARLRDATLDMYGIALDGDALRSRMRAALAGSGDACTLRVVVRGDVVDGKAGIDVDVEIEPSREPRSSSLRLRAHRGLRVRPGLKHLAIGAQLDARRAAQAAGFDDALLVAADGCIAEGTFWNVAFWDGNVVTWPDAPSLDGVTRRLLQGALTAAGVPQHHRPLALDAISGMRAAVALNSRGVQDIASIDRHALVGDAHFVSTLRTLLADIPRHAP
ncbi:aminotransferase class IV [Luteimonas sp. A649]